MKAPRFHPPLNLLKKEPARPWAWDASFATAARPATPPEAALFFCVLPSLLAAPECHWAEKQFATPPPRNQKKPSWSRPGSAQERRQLPHSGTPFPGPQPAQGQKCVL